MSQFSDIAAIIAERRTARKMSQTELARAAGVSRSTVDALENGRIGELGFTKVAKLLTVLGLELRIEEAGQRRPTLEELLKDDQDLDRRR